MTDFAKKVYKIVKQIPRGSVMTYKEVARRAGNPKAARAVGNLMAKNKNWPAIPCHRVVLADGQIGNWSGKGRKRQKAELLRLEGHIIQDFKIQDTVRPILPQLLHDF